MLYFLYGTDTKKARSKLHDILYTLEQKRPEAEIFKLNSETWNESVFSELLVSQGLFEKKYTVVLDNIPDKNHVMSKLKDMAISENVFLWLETKVLAEELKKIEKHASKIQEFQKNEDRKSAFNIFSITDDLVKKDKKHLWVSYIDLVLKGAIPEEIHGILFWQIKNMLLVCKTKDTGLSPFVERNALSGSKKYSPDELKKFSKELIGMTHKVRTGEGELGFLLEKWILDL